MTRRDGFRRKMMRVKGGRVCMIALLMACSMAAQADLRKLTGTVQDKKHAPLKGAVVVVQNESDNAIETYLTDGDGYFIFRRLSSGADYRVTVTYQGQKAKAKEISHFDSKPNKVLRFVIGEP